MTEILHGETFDLIAISIGRIVDVLTFKPTDIPVRAGQDDIMVRTVSNALSYYRKTVDNKSSAMNKGTPKNPIKLPHYAYLKRRYGTAFHVTSVPQLMSADKKSLPKLNLYNKLATYVFSESRQDIRR